MKRSKNLDLWLPEGTDPLEVDRLSENFEALDDFAKLTDPYKVGDIRHTLRTDLGDDWLLCNGENFDPQKYPELSGKLGGLEEMAGMAAINTQNIAEPSSWASDGKTLVLTTGSRNGGTNATRYAYWSTDNFKTVTPTSLGSAAFAVPFYVNGRWIFFLFTYSSNGTFLTKISACEQAFTAPGNAATPPSGATDITNVMHVEYAGGKYYAFAGTSTGVCAVLTSSSPNFSGATVSYVNSKAQYVAYVSFAKVDGKYVFIRASLSSSNFYDVSWSSSPASGYQSRSVTTVSNGYSVTMADIMSAASYFKPLVRDGKVFWVAKGPVNNNVTPATSPIILVCLDGVESGDVKYINIGTTTRAVVANSIFSVGDQLAFFQIDTNTSSSSKCVVSLMVSNGDPVRAGSWKKITLIQDGPILNSLRTQFQSESAIGAFGSGTNSFVFVPLSAAPRISIPNCYTYIKAK